MSADTFTVRVYYEDTDFSGNVYYAAYLHFFERARTEFLRARGVHHTELLNDGVAFAVRKLQIEYLAAAHIDDALEVATELVQLTAARLDLRQTISRDGVELTRAEVQLVAIKMQGGVTRFPVLVRTALTSDP
ncbi:YbgC/FadM family acyl-CoA thioesterase [Devosia sp.]|uniref:YbgC/FadM family acyl-CoA thioesterase n=1 Tax=Devosia sp. TaxID=1871048 RepID=UPI003A8C8D58